MNNVCRFLGSVPANCLRDSLVFSIYFFFLIQRMSAYVFLLTSIVLIRDSCFPVTYTEYMTGCSINERDPRIHLTNTFVLFLL